MTVQTAPCYIHTVVLTQYHQPRFYAASNFLKMGIKYLNLSSFIQVVTIKDEKSTAKFHRDGFPTNFHRSEMHTFAAKRQKYASHPQKFMSCKNVLDVLYHRAKFGGARISPAADGRQKR